MRNALSRFGRSSISAEYGFLLHWAGPWLSILLLYDKMCIAVSLEAASALFGCGYHLWWFIAGWTVSGHFFLARYFDVRIGIVLRFAFSAGRGWVLCAGLCNVVFVITLERIVRGRLFGGPINVALPVRVCVVAGGEIVLHDGDASVVSSHPNPLQVYWTWDGLCKATASGQNVRQPGFVWALVIETLHLLAKLPQA